eukprot:scaffold91440_cov53-Phaeocystis_antarctica.AAC.1
MRASHALPVSASPRATTGRTSCPRLTAARYSKCEVLIVLLSPGFYNSKPCLLEAHKATKADPMEIIPLRVAEPLPGKNDQWPDIGEADGTLLDQVQ